MNNTTEQTSKPVLQAPDAGSIKYDTFLNAYITCALWSSTDGDGEPLDANYSVTDLSPLAVASMAEDCAAFQRDNAKMLATCGLSDERAGHDFWLTRNGHGSGFWDEYFDESEQAAACEVLSEACALVGSSDLYVGDDGQLYLS